MKFLLLVFTTMLFYSCLTERKIVKKAIKYKVKITELSEKYYGRDSLFTEVYKSGFKDFFEKKDKRFIRHKLKIRYVEFSYQYQRRKGYFKVDSVFVYSGKGALFKDYHYVIFDMKKVKRDSLIDPELKINMKSTMGDENKYYRIEKGIYYYSEPYVFFD